ncbi:endoplasmic reticulum junction formation protein lunapark [Rhinatrema bivittatum]|uniref:endoplasmic reticulum junction formation protein lunapark n=1 Tax=Rhinatrema bivittatum TaxID=194408 RepID=UPI00112B305B|nr:endoplasmic reticulum junction formation protein lunapark [Rhinatrema bivittatum]XP_029461702.1 endoplasmic reticulum junction formation protein lunapark [Rhinatrema bivittatum]XP_029461703.1 endoplasmic reticulum junction formation protein lunapark [Rhinatrema bivittatum]XP_029461704.1 endoplasmic reticulum junction formation protein lunapark [Rhinatrema bivittatum]
MGGLVSRWKAKPSTVEVLEDIDKKIQALEEFREKNQRLQKLWVGRLLLYSSVFFLLTCLIVYLWYLPEEWTARIIMTLPFFAFPVIVWFIRTLLILWFSRRTERNNDALEELKVEKKKILEEVMEKETYKTAKLILERFDPDTKKTQESEIPSVGQSATLRPGQELRQRTAAQRNLTTSTPVNPSQGSPQAPGVLAGASPLQRDTSAPGGPPERTVPPAAQSNILPRCPGSPATMPGMGLHPPGPPLARPVLPRERGALDRVVEYLVGDGPQNRYALICQQCFSHNGMALKEEFEYIAFRCAYCFFLNPARKTRPQAPRLQEFSFEKTQTADSQSIVGSSQTGGTNLSENQSRSELLEQIVPPDETDQTSEEKVSSTEEQWDDLAEEEKKEASEKKKISEASSVADESLMETE